MGANSRGIMKINENENIIDRDDNNVDYSRKRRVHKNSGISGKYDRFSPEDLIVETDTWDGNPSVNKKSWPLGDMFSDDINYRHYLLNKGKSHRKHRRLRNFFRTNDLDIDIVHPSDVD